jgi:IrrE N-terminal-like domain
MKTLKARRGPFAEQPYFRLDEIDQMCAIELLNLDLLPTAPSPIRIDRFIEKRFRVTIEYDDLGPDILGLTKFGKGGVTSVVVSRRLDEDETLVGEQRVRSTLAHEAGHGLLHGPLFAVSGQCALFPEGLSNAPKVLCRSESQANYRGEWWEFQANCAIGGFLLPKRLVTAAIEPLLTSAGALGSRVLVSGARSEATRLAAEYFAVSRQAAGIRLNALFPEVAIDQGEL